MSMRATAHSAMIRTKTAIHSSTGEYSFKRHLKKWTIWDRKEQYKNAKEKKGQTDQLDLSPDRSIDKNKKKGQGDMRDLSPDRSVHNVVRCQLRHEGLLVSSAALNKRFCQSAAGWMSRIALHIVGLSCSVSFFLRVVFRGFSCNRHIHWARETFF